MSELVSETIDEFDRDGVVRITGMAFGWVAPTSAFEEDRTA